MSRAFKENYNYQNAASQQKTARELALRAAREKFIQAAIDAMDEKTREEDGKADKEPPIKLRPGSGKTEVREPRTRDYFENAIAIATDQGFDGLNDWWSKTTQNGETIVKSQQQDNQGIPTVFYGVDSNAHGQSEISDSKQISTGREKSAGFDEELLEDEKKLVEDEKNKEKKKKIPHKFYGDDIVKGATLTTDGVFGAVLSTGGAGREGEILDPMKDINKIVDGVIYIGNIKEIVITIVGWEGDDWRLDEKEHYEGTLGSARYNLERAFKAALKSADVKVRFTPVQVEKGGSNITTRTIIHFN